MVDKTSYKVKVNYSGEQNECLDRQIAQVVGRDPDVWGCRRGGRGGLDMGRREMEWWMASKEDMDAAVKQLDLVGAKWQEVFDLVEINLIGCITRRVVRPAGEIGKQEMKQEIKIGRASCRERV